LIVGNVGLFVNPRLAPKLLNFETLAPDGTDGEDLSEDEYEQQDEENEEEVLPS
jgi:hypothetical protein